MPTNAGATESSLDAVVSSEPPSNSDVDASNGVTVVVRADSLDSKTETLTTEPCSGDIIVQDLVAVDDARVSVAPAGSYGVKIGVDLLESSSSGHDGGGDIVVRDSVEDARVSRDGIGIVVEDSELVQDLVDDATVSGDGIGIDTDNGEKALSEPISDAVVSSVPPAASYGVEIGADLLESRSGTLIMETSGHDGDHNGVGDTVIQDSIDDSRASRDEKGIVVENIEKVSDENEVNNEEKEGAYKVVQDSVNDTRVSVDETGIVMNNSELVLDRSISDAVVSSEPLSNGDIDAVTEVKIGAGSLGSETETITMKPSSDHNGNGDTVVQDAIDDSSASRDEKGIVMENIENVSDENEVNNEEKEGEYMVVQDSVNDTRVSVDETGIAMNNSELVSSEPPNNGDIDAVNEVKLGADSFGSETETLTMKPTADHNDGDIVVQDSVDDSSASRDEKVIVMEKISEENEVNNEEKEGEYKVTDLVWAKVKNYPWWPGQIFDPSSSTDKAKKHSNKKGLLVGYFGDETFAWNKPSNIKPFRKNFCKLEKQSNSKAFFHAMDCALDEVSRRVGFGLACSCLSREVYDKIKSQDFVNAGIRKEDSKIDGGDRFSTVSTFKPVKVVQSVQDLAREHFDGFSRLEVLSVRTQLLAFFRWKGYYQFQAQNILDGPDNKLEDESELPLTEENKVVEDEKPASVGKKVSSKKRKPDVCDSDDSVPRKKERSLTNVTPKGNLSVKRSKQSISKKATVEDNAIEEEKGNEKPVSVGKKVSSKKNRPDVCDSDDSGDSVPHKKEGSLTSVIPKGNSSVKRSKQSISKKATVEDNAIEEENGNEKPVSVGKKVSSKKVKPDVCDSDDSDDSDDSVPRKKGRSLTSVTPKGNSSVKRSKQSISKKATVEDDAIEEENENEKPVSVGKKVSSKKVKPDVCDNDDSDDSVPRKKERSLKSVTPKGTSSVKRSKQSISKKSTIEDNAIKEENGNEKPVSLGKKVSSKKRKPDVCDSDDLVARKKERSSTNMTSKGNSSVKRSKKGISKKDNAFKEENRNETGDKKSSISSPKRPFRVGDSICRIAKQIVESPSSLKKESQELKNDDEEDC